MPRRSSLDNFRSRLARAVQILSTATSVLLLTGVAAGLTLGRPALHARAAALRHSELRVQIAWPPLGGDGAARAAAAGLPNTWLDEKNRTRLAQLALDTLSTDPFDAASLRAAQDALMRTGWFASQVRVQRHADGLVTIRGTWRIPAAVVRVTAGSIVAGGEFPDHLVSGKGERLSAVYARDTSGLKIIVGARNPPPDLGEPWPGGDVQAGLALLGALRDIPGAAQVYAVDASEFLSKKRLTIITDKQTRIVWGGHPGEFSPGQARDDVKRERLNRLFKESGRIDGNRPSIDISLASGF